MKTGNTIEEQATGCSNAHSYQKFAIDNGYTIVEVLNWTSSAGDWQFIVSKDGNEWFVLNQTNNYPRYGFSHSIDLEHPFYGTKEDVFAEIEAMFE